MVYTHENIFDIMSTDALLVLTKVTMVNENGMNSTMSKKVILLGIDGGTFNLIEPFIKKGELPTFKRVLEEGCHGNLETTIPCLSMPAIPSLFTGMNPGKLGIFGFLKDNGSPLTYNDIKEEAFWDILGDEGYKSCVVNFTGTYPPRIRNGIMIAGNAPSEDSEYTYPTEMKSKVSGFYVEFERVKKLEEHPEKNMDKIIAHAQSTVNERWKIFKNLMTSNDFDLGALWIVLSDDIQYYFWELKGVMLGFFRKIDDILKDLIETFVDYNFIIVSDHGFEKYPKYYFHINTWLRNKGYLKMKRGKLRKWLIDRMLVVLPHLRKRLSNKQIYFLLDIKSKFSSSNSPVKGNTYYRKRDRGFLLGVDWKNTLAYVDRGFGWGIRMNVKDPELYENTRMKIMEELRRLTNDEGELMFREICKKEDIFSGKYLDEVPDIILRPTSKYRVNQLLVEKMITRSDEFETIKGSHGNARNGIFIAYGPVFKKGCQVKALNILDVAPTILHLMGCKVPENMDGRVMKEIFKKRSEPERREIDYQRQKKEKEEKKHEIDQEEIDKLKERLRALGYLDGKH